MAGSARERGEGRRECREEGKRGEEDALEDCVPFVDGPRFCTSPAARSEVSPSLLRCWRCETSELRAAGIGPPGRSSRGTRAGIRWPHQGTQSTARGPSRAGKSTATFGFDRYRVCGWVLPFPVACIAGSRGPVGGPRGDEPPRSSMHGPSKSRPICGVQSVLTFRIERNGGRERDASGVAAIRGRTASRRGCLGRLPCGRLGGNAS